MEKWTRLLILTATTLLLLAFVAVAIRLTQYINHTLLLFALGGLIAYALDPLVERLRSTRLNKSQRETPRALSVAVVFLGLFAVVGLSIWSLGDHLAAQVIAVQRNWPQYQARGLALAGQADTALAAHGIHINIESELQNPPPDVKTFAANLGKETVPLVRRVSTDLGETLVVLLIALYFLMQASEMRLKFNALLPPNIRPRAELWETDVNRICGGFVRGQLILAIFHAVAAALVCLLLGLHAWLVIGLVVGITSLIPVFGPYVGTVPAVIAALVSPTHIFGFTLTPVAAAIFILVTFTAINEIGSKILYPKLVGQALGLHEVLTLFVLFAGLEIGGIVGVLFAAPVTALAIVSVVHLYRFWQDLPDSLLSNVAREEAGERPLPAPVTHTDSPGLGESPAPASRS